MLAITLIGLSSCLVLVAPQGYYPQQGRPYYRQRVGWGALPPPPIGGYQGGGGYYGYYPGFNNYYAACPTCCANQPCYYNANYTTPLFPTRAPNNTARPFFGPPVALPNNSVLFPNGTVRFPNATLLMTRYANGTVPPGARTPAGYLLFANGTVLAPRATGTFPPPGIPLNATAESTVYPPVMLPNNTSVFYNGSLWTPGLSRINTVFVRTPCMGLACHHVYLSG